MSPPGGYDSRVPENVAYHSSLLSLAESLSLRCATTRTLITALSIPTDVSVLFLLSVPATLKTLLLRSAQLLVYTPPNEHFGIVPLEAMLAATPVLAADSGGPLETVVDGETGWLRSVEQVDQWTEVMDRVVNGMGVEEVKVMGEEGRSRVKRLFSEETMARRLEEEIERMKGSRRRQRGAWMPLVVGLLAVMVGVWMIWKGR
jgi:alpha-1,3/alpha-1,6-mannosyltransferase